MNDFSPGNTKVSQNQLYRTNVDNLVLASAFPCRNVSIWTAATLGRYPYQIVSLRNYLLGQLYGVIPRSF